MEQHVTDSVVSLNTIESNNNLMPWGIAINHHWEGNEGNRIYWNHLLGTFTNEKVHIEVDTPNEKFENELIERTGNDIWVQIGMGKGTLVVDGEEYNRSTQITQDTISSHAIKAIAEANSTFVQWAEELECEGSDCTVENATLLDVVALFKSLENNESNESVMLIDENRTLENNQSDDSYVSSVDNNTTVTSDTNTSTVDTNESNETEIEIREVVLIINRDEVEHEENTDGSLLIRSSSSNETGSLIMQSEIEVKSDGHVHNRVSLGEVTSEVFIDMVGSNVKMEEDGSLTMEVPNTQVSIAISNEGIVEVNSESLSLPAFKLGTQITVAEDENGDVKINTQFPSMDKGESLRF